MNAAKTSSTEAVHLLLNRDPSNGHKVLADPNVADKNGLTALAFSLSTNNIEVINKLAEVTTKVTDTTVKILAQSTVKIEGQLGKYVEKILNDGHKWVLMLLATFFGNPLMLDYLLSSEQSKALNALMYQKLSTDKCGECYQV